MARAVHDLRALVLSAVPILPLAGLGMGAGCILPPSLDSDVQDAGVNSPPAITRVSNDASNLFEPGPIAITRGSGQITFGLLDTDLGDTLFVRVFVDYEITDPTPPRALCSSGTGSADRTVICPAGTICQSEDDGERHNLTAVVFDREPLETGDSPAFQAMPDDGRSTSRFFFVDCAGPQP